MKYLKVILGAFGAISVLLMVGLLVGLLIETGPTKDEEFAWTPPNEIGGVYLEMTRSDLLFNFEYRCWKPNDNLISFLADDSSGVRTCNEMGVKDGRGPSVHLKNDVVTKLEDFSYIRSVGITAEEIQNRFGEPDILTINEDLSGRVYTYLDHRFSIFFRRNEPSRYKTGDLGWSDVRWNSYDSGEIFVRGELVCPSPKCPFSENGLLRDDYPYKTPFDLP